MCDRYLALARDASSAGDRIKAEGYLQHAEHYYRVVHGDDAQQGQNQGERQAQGQGQGRFNGRRNNMGSPAELALSGEHAPVIQVSEQSQPEQESGAKPEGGAEASATSSEAETVGSKPANGRKSAVEEPGDTEAVQPESDAATNA